MTQDEIIEIYKEVSNKLCNSKEWCWAGVGEPLQLFAKLVAQRTWVGLTDEDDIDWDEGDLKSLVRAVEAKLKDKNT
jgi:hypothetical protein